MRHRKITSFTLIAVLALTCLAGGCGNTAAESSVPENTADSSESAGELQPFSPPVSFEAVSTDGTEITSALFSDASLTMVNVWATYCNPCLAEMPDLGELASEYSPDTFQIIGVISDVLEGDDDGLSTALSLIEETGADYTHLLLNESLYNAMLTDVTAVPTTFFVDADGKILDTVVGSQTKDTWKELIDEYLEQ